MMPEVLQWLQVQKSLAFSLSRTARLPTLHAHPDAPVHHSSRAAAPAVAMLTSTVVFGMGAPSWSARDRVNGCFDPRSSEQQRSSLAL
jgi:hypothetical protein